MMTNLQTESPATGTFWHGGPTGLVVDDLITSPFERFGVAAELMTLGLGPADPRRVYISTDADFARAFAVIKARDRDHKPCLYKVDPQGPVLEDPDFIGDHISYTARRATILQVAEPHIGITAAQARQLLAPYSRWTDDRPVYTPDGYLTASPDLRAHGYADDDLRTFGQWIARDAVTCDSWTGKLRAAGLRGI